MAKKKKAAQPAAEEAKEPLPVVFLAVEIKSPSFSTEARIQAGALLWRLQNGDAIPMLHNRPLPSVGKRCGELRVRDGDVWWRLMYRRDSDAIVVAEIFPKKDQQTPQKNIDTFTARLTAYDQIDRESRTKK